MEHRCMDCAKRKECKNKRVNKHKTNNCKEYVPDTEKYARKLRARVGR